MDLGLYFVSRTVELSGTISVAVGKEQGIVWMAWERMYEIKFCFASFKYEMPIKIQTDMSTDRDIKSSTQ